MTTEIKMSWDEFENTIHALAEQIKESGMEFKTLYGVPRGGLCVAVRLSHLLGLPLTKFPEETTLICDDIVDSGKTLANDAREGYKIAVLYYYPEAPFKPDFYVLEKPKNSRIIFPWEGR